MMNEIFISSIAGAFSGFASNLVIFKILESKTGLVYFTAPPCNPGLGFTLWLFYFLPSTHRRPSCSK